MPRQLATVLAIHTPTYVVTAIIEFIERLISLDFRLASQPLMLADIIRPLFRNNLNRSYFRFSFVFQSFYLRNYTVNILLLIRHSIGYDRPGIRIARPRPVNRHIR